MSIMQPFRLLKLLFLLKNLSFKFYNITFISITYLFFLYFIWMHRIKLYNNTHIIKNGLLENQ